MVDAGHKAEARDAQTVRSFIAIELDRAVLQALDQVQTDLKRRVGREVVRWVRSDGVHLTLKFLGNVPAGQVPVIEQGLRRVCAAYHPFTLYCANVGCFPHERRPRVVWVGVEEPSGTLLALQRAVEEEIAPLGYPTESRAFTPHLTLGRAQRSASPSELRQLGELVASYRSDRIAAMEVRSVSLMRSELRPTGAVYTCLAAVPLGSDR